MFQYGKTQVTYVASANRVVIPEYLLQPPVFHPANPVSVTVIFIIVVIIVIIIATVIAVVGINIRVIVLINVHIIIIIIIADSYPDHHQNHQWDISNSVQ